MTVTPEEIEVVLEQMRTILMRWHKDDTLGEVAILRGGQELQVEERPRRKHSPVKRASRRAGYVEKVSNI